MLCAEALTIDYGTLLTVAGIIFGAGTALGVLKLKAKMAEKKQEEDAEASKSATAKLEKVDDRIFDEIKNLGNTMQRQFRNQNEKQAASEKSMIGKLDVFQSKVMSKFDDVNQKLATHDKRLTVSETEARHTREAVERHGQKITLMRKSPFGSENK